MYSTSELKSMLFIDIETTAQHKTLNDLNDLRKSISTLSNIEHIVLPSNKTRPPIHSGIKSMSDNSLL